MNNMHSVKSRFDVLRHEKQRLVAELVKAHGQIQFKLSTIKKLFLYQASFSSQTMLKTRGVSIINQRHLQLLAKKIIHLIIFEETEVTKLALISCALAERIQNVERKMQLTEMFAHR